MFLAHDPSWNHISLGQNITNVTDFALPYTDATTAVISDFPALPCDNPDPVTGCVGQPIPPGTYGCFETYVGGPVLCIDPMRHPYDPLPPHGIPSCVCCDENYSELTFDTLGDKRCSRPIDPDYPYPYDPYATPYPIYQYTEPAPESKAPVAVFSLVSLLMQFGGMGVYFGLIHDKDFGASVRGMLLANQLTWGLTSILGLYALFSDSSQALDMFSFAVLLGMFG
jgi:hypothetical protein